MVSFFSYSNILVSELSFYCFFTSQPVCFKSTEKTKSHRTGKDLLLSKCVYEGTQNFVIQMFSWVLELRHKEKRSWAEREPQQSGKEVLRAVCGRTHWQERQKQINRASQQEGDKSYRRKAFTGKLKASNMPEESQSAGSGKWASDCPWPMKVSSQVLENLHGWMWAQGEQLTDRQLLLLIRKWWGALPLAPRCHSPFLLTCFYLTLLLVILPDHFMLMLPLPITYNVLK